MKTNESREGAEKMALNAGKKKGTPEFEALVKKFMKSMGTKKEATKGAAGGPRDGRGNGPEDGRGGRCSGKAKKSRVADLIKKVAEGSKPSEVLDEILSTSLNKTIRTLTQHFAKLSPRVSEGVIWDWLDQMDMKDVDLREFNYTLINLNSYLARL